MSPTYWTASQIKATARAHGWTIVPSSDGGISWTLTKGRRKAQIWEDRRGGLTSVVLTRPAAGGADAVHYGPRYRGKLAILLAFLIEVM